jgi:predicted nucleic acid-binding protein
VIQEFDAVLAAVTLNREAQLVSSDRAFATVPGLRHVDPAGPDFERLVG